MSPEKLAYMANQIGRFFASQKHQDPVAGIADHLEKFWDPSMRRAIVAHLDDGTIRLDPLVHDAVARLKQARPG
jgi:formate dehydrogenase subunit delta